jgi:Domain of unknown function (DUF397)
MDVDPDGATWRKSSFSNGTGGECVEVADLHGGRAVRDSKHPEGPILVFTREGWQAFVQGIQAGELCAELEPVCEGHQRAPGDQSRRHGGARSPADHPQWLVPTPCQNGASGEGRPDRQDRLLVRTRAPAFPRMHNSPRTGHT